MLICFIAVLVSQFESVDVYVAWPVMRSMFRVAPGIGWSSKTFSWNEWAEKMHERINIIF